MQKLHYFRVWVEIVPTCSIARPFNIQICLSLLSQLKLMGGLRSQIFEALRLLRQRFG